MEQLLMGRDQACRYLGISLGKFLELSESDKTFPRPVDVPTFSTKLLYKTTDFDKWVSNLATKGGEQ